MKTAPDIGFATAWQLTEFLVNPGTEIRVGPFGEHLVELRLWSPETDGTSAVPTESRSMEVFAKCRLAPSNRARQLLEEFHDAITPVADEKAISLAQEKAVSRIPPPTKDLSPSGPCCQERNTRLDEMLATSPEPRKELIKKVSETTRTEALRFLKLLRWRTVRDFDFSLPFRTGIYWQSLLDGRWRRIPSRPEKPGALNIVVGISGWPHIVQDVNARLVQNAPAPMCFDLLCEARRLASSHARLSLVEAVQSLEMGTKDAVGRLCPHARWLAYEIPSPPVIKILEEYIPLLINKAEVQKEFREFVAKRSKDIKKIIFQRNEIAHKGLEVDSDSAHFACDLAGDVLYRLDFACGEAWVAAAIWDRASVTAQYVKCT